jgi:hypothetical protein
MPAFTLSTFTILGRRASKATYGERTLAISATCRFPDGGLKAIVSLPGGANVLAAGTYAARWPAVEERPSEAGALSGMWMGCAKAAAI